MTYDPDWILGNAHATVAQMRRDHGRPTLNPDAIEIDAWRFDSNGDVVLGNDDASVYDDPDAQWCVFLHFPDAGRDEVANFRSAEQAKAAGDLVAYHFFGLDP